MNSVFTRAGRSVITIGLLSAASVAYAGPQCTTADRAEWQDEAAFQEKLKADGYEIKVFKVTDGNCYEIYGWDKDRRKVEIYFDPVSGSAVKTEID
ncbi:MAG: PepSY domain-containing protein [Pseudomonadales bacterium]